MKISLHHEYIKTSEHVSETHLPDGARIMDIKFEGAGAFRVIYYIEYDDNGHVVG